MEGVGERDVYEVDLRVREQLFVGLVGDLEAVFGSVMRGGVRIAGRYSPKDYVLVCFRGFNDYNDRVSNLLNNSIASKG